MFALGYPWLSGDVPQFLHQIPNLLDGNWMKTWARCFQKVFAFFLIFNNQRVFGNKCYAFRSVIKLSNVRGTMNMFVVKRLVCYNLINLLTTRSITLEWKAKTYNECNSISILGGHWNGLIVSLISCAGVFSFTPLLKQRDLGNWLIQVRSRHGNVTTWPVINFVGVRLRRRNCSAKNKLKWMWETQWF